MELAAIANRTIVEPVTFDDVLRPIDPSTGQVLETVAQTAVEDVARAVGSARAAQSAWGRSIDERIGAVKRFVERLREPEVREALAQSVRTEMGKPIRHARAEVDSVVARTEQFFERARAACADEVAREQTVQVVTQWRPLGVVAVIAPWNYPLATPNNLVMSGLLVGNAVVLKPSEQTPHTGAAYVRLLREHVGDAIGIVQGARAVGEALVRSDVNMVAFTGSVATGQAIMREAATCMKRLVLEMGGKDPMLVLPGADVGRAADHAVRSALGNTGQMCVAAERILVHREVHAAFVAEVVQRVKFMKTGDPALEATELGPLASERQRDAVLAHIADAKAKGARVLVEGRLRSPGWFLEPTVIDGVDATMRIATEETFGPVVSIEEVESVDAAVRRANETQFGLGASVWGAPGAELEAVGGRIDAGMIGLNRGLSAAAGAPWVGWKMSGFGYSRSEAGFRQFLQPRTISRNV